MKLLLAASIGCITLAVSTSLFAGCYEAGRFTSCGTCESGSRYVTECNCTDPGVIRHNPCMTTAKYCEAFGNVGGYMECMRDS